MSVQKKNTYKFNYDELSGICFQIALMLHSGILIYDGVEAMCSVRDHTTGGQRVLQGIADELKESALLSDAMQKSGAFPSYMIGMVELGESTGHLEDVMTALSNHYKREERMRGMIIGAVFYPAILCIMICAVIVVLVIRILPEFSRVLEDMGVESSPFIQALISLGGIGSEYILLLIILIFAGVGGLVLYSKLTGRDLTLRDVLLKIPFLHRISDKIAAGQFASAMALALSSGYEIQDAFTVLHTIITNRRALEKIKLVDANVADGKSFSQAVILSGLFRGMPERMVAVGEKAGRVDEVMHEISNIYEDETSVAINNVVSTIEPVMVAFLAVVTGVIMLVIMLPLLGIISSMN